MRCTEKKQSGVKLRKWGACAIVDRFLRKQLHKKADLCNCWLIFEQTIASQITCPKAVRVADLLMSNCCFRSTKSWICRKTNYLLA